MTIFSDFSPIFGEKFGGFFENQAPMLRFYKYFRRKNNLAFLNPNKAKLGKKLIITFVFEKNANFITQNWQKSQKL
jgi:hypothetical protein